MNGDWWDDDWSLFLPIMTILGGVLGGVTGGAQGCVTGIVVAVVLWGMVRVP